MQNPQQALEQRAHRLQTYWQQDPDNLSLMTDLADVRLQLSRWEDAVPVLEALLSKRPEDALSRYRWAVAQRGLGHTEAAETALQSLLDTGVTHPAVRLEAARLRASLNQWSGVWTALEPLTPAACPPDLQQEVWLLSLRALHHQGLMAQAMELAQHWQAAGVQPQTPVCAALATLALDAEALPQARLWIAAAGSDAATNPELLVASAYLDMSEGHLNQAQTRFAQSLERSPSMGRAHLGLGLAQAAQGHLTEAISALSQAVKTMPTHLGSWHALAWLQLMQDDVDGAARTFEQALAQNRNFGDSHGGMALIAALRGQTQSAHAWLRTARRLDPQSMNAVMAQAVLDHGQGLSSNEVMQQGLNHLKTVLQGRPEWLTLFTRLSSASQHTH